MGTFCYFIDLVLDNSQTGGNNKFMTATFEIEIEIEARDKLLMIVSSQILAVGFIYFRPPKSGF